MTSRPARDPRAEPARESPPIGLWLALGVGLPALSSAALMAGLGAMLLPGGSPAARFALHLPGLLLGACFLGLAALRRLSHVAPRWHPGDLVPGLERRSELPLRPAPRTPSAPAPTPAHIENDVHLPAPGRPAVSPREAPAELALVHLGPRADPAWAAWGLRWEAPGHGSGFVPLPPGARLVLGRDPGAEVVVRLDRVSWHHLELDVRDATVTVRELGSSNGTFRPAATAPQPDRADAADTADAADATADPALGPEPVILAAGDRLLLAHPTALVLTLEALR